MEESSSPPPRQQPNWRSAASNNWRVKDDSPRVETQQPRQRFERNQEGQERNPQGYSRNNSSSQQGSGGDDAPGTRLYVGNLLYTAQKPDIEALFKEHGFNVVSVSMSTDPFTGRNPSYCFVDLSSADEAQRAMGEMNGVDVMGRQLRVSPGVARRQGSASNAGSDMRQKNYEGGRVQESRGQRDGNYKPSFDRWNRTDATSHWQAPQAEGRRLYLGSMPRIEPQSAHDQEVQTLFAQYAPGIEITAVSKQISPKVVPEDERNNNLYYCFVDLQEGADVDAVIEALNGKEGSWGGNLRVSRAKNSSDRKVTREQNLQNFSGGGESKRSFGFGGGENRWRRGAEASES